MKYDKSRVCFTAEEFIELKEIIWDENALSEIMDRIIESGETFMPEQIIELDGSVSQKVLTKASLEDLEVYIDIEERAPEKKKRGGFFKFLAVLETIFGDD